MDNQLLAKLYEDHVATLVRSYDTVLRAAHYDVVAVHSGSLQKRSAFDDQYWPLRATPHFQHWLGLAEPDCALVVEPGAKPVLARVKVTSFWEKPPRPETDHFMRALDVREIDATEDVKKLLKAGKRVAFVGEDASRAHAWGVAAEHVNPPALLKALDKLRTTKTAYEVACLEEATVRAAAGHDAVLRAFRGGSSSELELHLAYLAATKQDDPETPYKNIVALGANAATLHHVSYGKSAPERSSDAQSLLLDAGASYQGYCSDITRTWVKGSSATAASFAHLIDGVEAMQKRLCTAVKIGMPYEALHEEAHRQLGAVLRDAGVVKGSAAEAVEAGITRAFFPHGLGHSLGLQCHDVGCAEISPKANNPFLRNTSIIAEAQVFTIEPGVYFIDALLAPVRAGAHAQSVDWKLVDALASLGGIRIEDDLVVASTGPARNLTREHLPNGGGSV